jgi:parallel beta-helix repeat protein
MRKMPKKEKKRNWKERQRERQIRQQHAQEAYQIQREREIKRKPRKWPKGKILAAVCLLVLIFGAYGAWQYTKSSNPLDEEPPAIPTSENIYISPDGQVSPSTTPILNVGNNHYTFTADIDNSIIIEKNNIVIDGANYTLQGTGAYPIGIDLVGRSNVTITNMKIKNFDFGVYLSSASYNVLSQNELTNNYCGIWIEASSNGNIISGNNIENNEMYAIWLTTSSNNTISENKLTSNFNYTVYLRSANYTTFSANYIANNYMGIFFRESSNNILYHNNFIDNVEHTASSASTNTWDNGYPSGGNYWSDYEEKYPNADKLGDSGIWNTPYVIDENNQDNYPRTDIWILD